MSEFIDLIVRILVRALKDLEEVAADNSLEASLRVAGGLSFCDRRVPALAGVDEVDRDLGVLDPSSGFGVLALDSNRVMPLFRWGRALPDGRVAGC
ncbi:hypothetical protein [Microbispora bryophytorum]|uniref:hypothetical protein n=1 Tax=Microbispora bryophytorum TaxID=1460882 RepID=UPI00360BBBA0